MESSRVLRKPPTLSNDTALDGLLKAKLRLEAEVEAIRESSEVPELAESGLFNTTQAVLEKDVHELKRTLKYFQNLDSTLQKQEESLSTTLERGRQIEAELNKCVTAPRAEAESNVIATRLRGISGVFKSTRTYFRSLLQDIEDERPELNLSSVLQVLCAKMFDSPSDPYVEVADMDINHTTLMFLLKLNLVQRHSHYPTKIRVLDPRKD